MRWRSQWNGSSASFRLQARSCLEIEGGKNNLGCVENCRPGLGVIALDKIEIFSRRWWGLMELMELTLFRQFACYEIEEHVWLVQWVSLHLRWSDDVFFSCYEMLMPLFRDVDAQSCCLWLFRPEVSHSWFILTEVTSPTNCFRCFLLYNGLPCILRTVQQYDGTAGCWISLHFVRVPSVPS